MNKPLWILAGITALFLILWFTTDNSVKIPVPSSAAGERPIIGKSRQNVTLKHDTLPYVTVGLDAEAFVSTLKAIRQDPGAVAEMDRMKKEGRLFQVPNGIHGELVAETPIPGTSLAIAHIRISEGPHKDRLVLCANSMVERP